jgi:hypothetical protein
MWNTLAGVNSEVLGSTGVRIFRVDPHTKAFAFWEWANANQGGPARSDFSVPKHSASGEICTGAVGSGLQPKSYTYFTRNALSRNAAPDYFPTTESGRWAQYLRPNVWPNTPITASGALRGTARRAEVVTWPGWRGAAL